MFIPDSTPRFLIPVRAAIVLGLCLATAGCNTLFSDDDGLTMTVPPERFQNIEPMRLEDRSTTDPVTVEDASRDLMERMANRPEPPASVDLSLADVRAAALENNLDLKVQLLAPAIAETSIDEEEARFEALFFGSATHNEVDSPTSVTTQGTRSVFNRFDAGVRIPMRTGGTTTVSIPTSRSSTNNPFSTLDPSYDTNAQFSISQPLLRDAWNEANTHGIRVAKYQSQISNALTRLEAIRILANADRAYWRLYAARRELEVRQKQYELAVAQLERAERQVEAGDAAEIEVVRAQSGIASRLEAILVAETNVRTLTRNLLRILNREDLPINAPTDVRTASAPRPLGMTLDSMTLAEFAVDNRMEMLELELQAAIDASTLSFERNRSLPLVTLDYTYNINGLAASLGNSVDQLASKRFEDWSVGLNVEIPLGNEAAEARVHRAVLTRLQRLATKELRELSIRQEVLDAVDVLNQNWQRILAARQEVILAGRTYEGEQRQFDQGLRTSTDVLDAAANLADAQSREIQALADYEIAKIDIAFATGTLLGQARVSWQPTTVSRDEADSIH